jgi:hypothetical protein
MPDYVFDFVTPYPDFDVKEFRLTPKKRGEMIIPRNLWFY